jgi:hypothetical protein
MSKLLCEPEGIGSNRAFGSAAAKALAASMDTKRSPGLARTRVGVCIEARTPRTSTSMKVGHRRTGDRPLEFAEHLAHTWGFGGLSVEQIGERALTPLAIDLVDLRFDLGCGEAPRKVGEILGEPRCRRVQSEEAEPLWVTGSEEEADRAAFARSDENGALGAYRVDDGTQIVDPVIEGEHLAGRVGKTYTASVPYD